MNNHYERIIAAELKNDFIEDYSPKSWEDWLNGRSVKASTQSWYDTPTHAILKLTTMAHTYSVTKPLMERFGDRVYRFKDIYLLIDRVDIIEYHVYIHYLKVSRLEDMSVKKDAAFTAEALIGCLEQYEFDVKPEHMFEIIDNTMYLVVHYNGAEFLDEIEYGQVLKIEYDEEIYPGIVKKRSKKELIIDLLWRI